LPTITAVSVDQYLRTYYDPDVEYVDGKLVDRHIGEYSHAAAQAWVAGALGSREQECRFRTFIGVRVVVKDGARYRIPDVSVRALPHPVTPFLSQPDLVVEVLSTEDEAIDFLVKIADYSNAGIPYIWIVDPYKRRMFAVEHGVIRHAHGMLLETPLVGQVDFSGAFE
jgi:Uma2 family endonuclease